jgi:hypothetical protein
MMGNDRCSTALRRLLPRSVALRLALTVAVAAFVAVSTDFRTAHAATATWNVYPGFAVSGIYDFGWHFDESPQYGAQDYNFVNDINANVVFSAKLSQTSAYPLRWRFDSTTKTCTVIVVAQAFVFGGWYDVAGTEMHYIHLTERVANGTVTATIQSNGSAVLNYLGHAGNCNIFVNAYHVHQSADLSTGSRMFRVWYTDDTCWSDTAGQNSYQCPGGNFILDNQNYSPCPPGQPQFARGAISGPLARYNCEEWSKQNRDYTLRAFYGVWQ